MYFFYNLLFLLLLPLSAFSAPLQFTGAETGDMLDEIFAVSGTQSLQSTTVKTGVFAYRTNPSNPNSGYVSLACIDINGVFATCGSSNVWLKFDFRADTRPSGGQGTTEILTGADIVGSTKFNLMLSSTGLLSVKDATGATLATGSTTIATTTWYRIEINVNSGVAGAYEVKIDGVSEISGTGNFTVASFGDFRFGVTTNLTNGSVNYFYDDLVMDDSEFPGIALVKKMSPDGDGSTAQWTSGTGASDWTQISEIPFNVADYEMSNTSGNQVTLATLESPSAAGIAGTIKGAKTLASRRENTTVTSSNKIRTRYNAVNTDSTAVNLTTTTDVRNQLLVTKPGGGAWNIAALDTTEIGAIEANAVSVRLNGAALMVLFDGIETSRLLPLTGVGK